MKRFRISRPSPSIIISCAALFAALGGTSYAAASAADPGSSMHPRGPTMMSGGQHSGNAWASHLGGLPSRDYMLAKHFISSNGVQFLNAGQTMTLGHAGHFTFTAACSADPSNNGSQSVTFKASSTMEASVDGNGPMPARADVPPIHVDSDSMDSTTGNALNPGDFAQVASASSSTEIANDGQEADIFYTDGVNWGGKPGTPGSHACFAGFTGVLSGGKSMNTNNPNPSPAPFSGTHS